MKLIEFFKDFEPKSDKGTSHCYIQEYYSEEMSEKQNDIIKLMEIGVKNGYSHILWDKYFTNGEIWGVDNGESGFIWEVLDDSRVKVFKNDAYNTEFINKNIPNDYFDFIIDDASHHPIHQKKFIDLYYSKLKVGGKLIIEDVQGKGYLKELEVHCKSKGLEYKSLDFTGVNGKIDDLMIEIIRK